jgi:sirohydrochlorin cobaltochelatase
VQKLARLLWEGMGYGWGAACYIGVTTPLLPEALERCRRLGFGRILVFPFFLFTGVLEKRIRHTAESFGREHPETDVLCAGYLNVHPLLLDVFRERAQEALHGSPNMNCELCKYRVRLPGFADAVGQPQEGHHHHVRGIGQEGLHNHHHGHDGHHHRAPHP